MRGSLWYYFLAPWSDDHLPKVGAPGGTLWMKYIIFEVLAGYCPFARVFVSLVVGCLWGYEGPFVGVVLLGQKLTYGLCLIGVKQQ